MKAERVSKEQILACAQNLNSDWLRVEMCLQCYCHKNPLIRWLFWSRQDKALELAQLGKNETVLEYGCGLGVALPALARSAKEVVAIDADVSAGRRMAQVRGIDNIRFVDQADQLSKLYEAIPPGSIDCINALDVFEHIEDLAPVAKLVGTLLSPRGRLVISGPTESWAYRLGRRIAGFTKIPGYGIENAFHKTNIYHIKTFFQQQGFRLTREAILPFWPLPRAFLLLRFEPSAAQKHGSFAA